MKNFWKNPVVAFFASLKLSAVLMGLVAIASARATFIEADLGREAAYGMIYAARWFEILLALLVVSLTLLFFKRWPYKGRQIGFVLLHVSIIIILIASAMTRYMGFEGTMRIREGESSNVYQTQHPYVQATLDGAKARFQVTAWKPGETDIRRSVRIGGEDYELGLTEFWPHFAEQFLPGEGGTPALQFGRTGNGRVTDDMLLMGDRTTIGRVQVKYLTAPFSAEISLSPYGDVRIHVDGETAAIPVGLPDGRSHEVGGYRFEVTEFQTAFRVGAGSNADGPLTNPMVRLAITAPDGTEGERLLFALHPDFSMGHSGGDDPFADLDLLYQVNSGCEFAPGGETGLQGRATFALQTAHMGTEERGEIPAGEIFPVTPEMLYVNDANEFSFVAARIHESVVRTPVLSANKNAPAAGRIVIRDGQGNEATAVCVRNGAPERVELAGRAVELSFGSILRTLPYSLRLENFELETYPGSDNPATYESYVVLDDPEQGIAGQKHHIYMNHPLTHRGTKHFQSSYDMDRRGTILSLNKDPGKWPTYFGYTLLTIGFVLVMLKDLLWPRRRSAKAAVGKTARAAALALALLAAGTALPGAAQAQTGHEGHNHGPVPDFITLSDPAREEASRLIVQDYRGRMKPLDTLAREVVRKVSMKFKIDDRDPVDQFLNWSLNAESWWNKPVIAVRYPGVKDILGIDHATSHVSAGSLFDRSGRYRLAAQVEEAHRTPDAERSKTQRKLITFNDRFEELYATLNGRSLRIFPVPGDENNTWLTYAEVAERLDGAAQQEYGAAWEALAGGMHLGNNAQIRDGIGRVAALQKQYGAEVLPSRMKVDAELIYNRANLFFWVIVIPLPLASAILMIVFLWNLFRTNNTKLAFGNWFYSSGLLVFVAAFAIMIFSYVLRWIASGRAPLSNGHESLLFIALAVALAALIFELAYRQAAPGGLGAILTFVVLGISMSSYFTPDIGPLVPVLVSYWLNIHVTVITASYGFLGLAALIGALVLVLLMLPATYRRQNVIDAIKTLDGINHWVLVAGLGLLSVGTLLGGVWANESWGRYWGWDPKETWSLITILVYAVVLHFRWIPQIRSVWLSASGSLAAIGSVIMTYFGVNYVLQAGLHSYGQGDQVSWPLWVKIFAAVVILMIALAGLVQRKRGLLKA